jgi:26S proteasome regulatory subunit N7
VSYAVTSSLISLDRVALKSRVVDSPEIRSVIGHVPALESCLNALYDCNYKEFFKVRSAVKYGVKYGVKFHVHVRWTAQRSAALSGTCRHLSRA